jgi:hypothetical protein
MRGRIHFLFPLNCAALSAGVKFECPPQLKLKVKNIQAIYEQSEYEAARRGFDIPRCPDLFIFES